MIYRLILACWFLTDTWVKCSCPNGGVEVESACLYFNITEHRFDKADRACVMGGGHLVSIHDIFANNAIQDMFFTLLIYKIKVVFCDEDHLATQYFSESTDTDFWIGGQKIDDNSAWTWTDGSTFEYSDWGKGEPSNINGFNCAALSIIDGYWSAQMCSKAKPFACAVPNQGGSTMTTI